MLGEDALGVELHPPRRRAEAHRGGEGRRTDRARGRPPGADAPGYVPFLFALFFFVLLNNLFATVPGLEFPTFSRAGMVYGLVLISWLVYNIAGIKAQGGVLAYLKHQTVPPGVPAPMLGLLIPLEFFSNLVVRPVTLALRTLPPLLYGEGHPYAIPFTGTGTEAARRSR